MKTRRWVLVIALFIGFILLIFYHGWNFFHVNDRLLKYTQQYLKNVLGETLSIDRLELAIGAIHFKDVDLDLREGYYHLHVDDIRFGFNFFNFLRYGFRIKRIPQDIIFIRPELIIRPIKQDMQNSEPLDSTLKSLKTNEYLKKFENLQSVSRITISKGKISFIDSTDQPLLLANDINGWLSISNVEKTTIRLVGKIFNSNDFNLSLSGYANLKQGRLDTLIARVTNYAWQKKDAFFLPDYYDVQKGLINGVLTLSERTSGYRGFDIKGDLSIQDGKIALPQQNLVFDNISVDTEVREWNLYVRHASALLNESPINITGMIKNILNPELNLTLASDSFDIGKLFTAVLPNWKIKPEGSTRLKIRLSNTFSDPHIRTNISSKRLRLSGREIKNLDINLAYQDSVFSVRSIQMYFDRLFCRGNASFDFSSSARQIRYQLNAEGFFPAGMIKIPIKTISDGYIELNLDGQGNFSDFLTDAALQIKSQSDDTLAIFRGFYRLRNSRLSWAFNDFRKKCSITGEYDFSGNKGLPKFRIVGLNHIVQHLPEYKKLLPFFHFRESEFVVRKKKESWIVNANLLWNGNPDLPREVDGTLVIHKKRSRWMVDGKFKLTAESVTYPGEFVVAIGKKSIDMSTFSIDNLLIAELEVGKGAVKELTGQVIFPNTQAADLARVIFRETKGIENGLIYGTVGFSGSLKNPAIAGKFDLSGMTFHGIGDYSGTVQFQLADKLFLLNQFDLNRNEKKLVRTRGTYNLEKKLLDFSFQGEDIDVNSTLTALFNKQNLLTGRADVDLKLSGDSGNPCVCGTIDIANGRFTRFYFDRLVFTLVDEKTFADADSTNKFDLSYPAVRLGNFSFMRNGEFQISGKGLIPIKRENPIDLDFQGKGNLLSILPEFSPFFKETKSEGVWTLHLHGLPGNVRLLGSRIELQNGYLRLGSVAPEIKEISLSLELESDGFIHVKNLSGKIRRREFVFRNQRLPSEPINDKFKPFEIPFLGLNLGIFTIETSPKGIPLHIPGLMEKGEYGQFIFLGKNKNEKFFIAGPAWQPYVRGKLILQNTNFTFPFIFDENAKKAADNLVVRVLRSIYWDVLALTGKDLHYQRQIPSGLDNVYLDLIIDAGVGGLQFTGRIEDNTLGVTGLLESSRGNVEYLNLNFQIVKAGAEFDMESPAEGSVKLDRSLLLPIVYGEARTTVIDSTGFPYYIYLTLLTRDRETGQTQKRGRLSEMVFQLSSENQQLGGTEGEILASLGYSTEKIKEMATDLIGISADNLLFRPLFRPFERELERRLGLDMVRFSSRFTRNLIEMNVNDERNFQVDSKLFLLRSTKVMIGKYLLNQIFLTYSGQLEAGLDYRYQHEGFGLSHKFGLEYRISPSLLLQMEYDYNSLLLYRREDKRILLRHSFPF